MILRKENVVLKEEDNGKIKELKAMGYQETDEHGKVKGKESKTVADATHKKTLNENKALKEEIKTLKEENAALKKELEEDKKASSK
ncbi:DUF5320 domain-containing protein [Virgibacillus sp. AGTR]|uniref:DUF5320 domain-containing protein n=1 Tax=unclassified Virgibacillus TaxID=2620237 RepID=UPI000EF4C925|nr:MULTISPECIES: DUF5320 domain-containing protein [unclassified Virgibacillus]MCC2250075.1 DUF5320 domain-containing protein [Virgibacillus sp. AGTR]QRZ17772.1 DUF5320 domain-containing protein [Virgibacillus sp. AGTR]